jgi:DNA-binding transcriptional ArsR family regulator
MVEQSALDTVFSALADPTRRAMLRRLAKGEHSVGELAAPFDMSFAGAAKHVKALEASGLIKRRVEGRTHICSLNPRPMHGAMEWLRYYENFWNERLDKLAEELGDPPRKAPSKKTRRRT